MKITIEKNELLEMFEACISWARATPEPTHEIVRKISEKLDELTK